ncbi:MAG TPA: efflux RND transporter periplasmic adaptor subunit [Gemmatimonadales bacterium]|nr:efflux RND transporter periplasmic adaptor subunit [Gemmatimonadales bacterium]
MTDARLSVLARGPGPVTPAARRGRAARSALAGALALYAAACAKHAESEGGTEAQPTVSAQVVEVTTQPFTQHLGVIGSVVPRPGHVAVLSAPAPTRIARVLVAGGQLVRRGEALVELEQTVFHASAQSAQAALQAAERNYERAQRLVEAGVAPRKDLYQAEADLERARADAVTARRNVELSVLRAPIDGAVTRMAAVLGASADANQPLVEVADPATLDVVLAVTPADAARIHPESKLELWAGEREGGDSLGPGVVVQIGSAVDSATRTVPVRARATKPARTLRIGETVWARIEVGVQPNAVVVPVAALIPEGDRFKVFVVDQDDVAHSRAVVVAARSDSLAQISNGLKPGERVVAAGAYGVADSAKIVAANP